MGEDANIPASATADESATDEDALCVQSILNLLKVYHPGEETLKQIRRHRPAFQWFALNMLKGYHQLVAEKEKKTKTTQ